MNSKFKDRVALVTGASSGIGRATALAFAREGAAVVLADVNEEQGRQVESEVKGLGVQSMFIKTDVSKSSEVESLIKRTVEKFGRLDCAHNNAGIEGSHVKTAEVDESQFDKVVAINLKGTWLCMKYELEFMLKQGFGSVVNTASVAAMVGVGGLAAYAASKHGIVGLTKTAALEYARDKIRINAVCPGPINTPMVKNVIKVTPEVEARILARQPQGRLGEPEEVASAVVWLSSPDASYVTGHAMLIDGGWIAQ